MKEGAEVAKEARKAKEGRWFFAKTKGKDKDKDSEGDGEG